jgi:hypothetical protein
MDAPAAHPIPPGDLGHRNPASTSSTARYLCSVTLKSHSMNGSVKHQAEPMCKASSGTTHIAKVGAVKDFITWFDDTLTEPASLEPAR